ncbi:MAG: recombinase family protein [Bacilli bacterium]
MENELLQLIKDVSIYLRKSRAKDGIETKDGMETDEILEKHKQELISFCEKYNFRYAIYQEVVSGDSISDRPEMIRLLQDVEDGLWDATLVVDIDRLGRGNEEDQGRIKRIYRQSETFIWNFKLF